MKTIKMIREDLPTEGVSIAGIGRVMPGVPFDAPENLAALLESKGYKPIDYNTTKEVRDDDMG